MSDNEQKEYDLDKSPFDWGKLEGLLAYKASLIVCAEMLGVHENTIKNHIKNRYGITFTEYSNRKLSATRIKLVQKALERAFGGNSTMLIFCLKNICGWADQVDQTISGGLKVEGYGLSFDLSKTPEQVAAENKEN